MPTINEINSYNEGTSFPAENYNDTYLATKHIQDYRLELPENLVETLKQKIKDEDIFLENDDTVEQIVAGILNGNIILQGPPGTGKTTLATIIADTFNVDFDIITAVSDWTTYDTLGGLQPAVDDDGNEIICGKNGRVVDSVLKCCNTVLSKEINGTSDKQGNWLIIDELNRTEIDKVFGDLFTSLGSDDEKIRKINLWFAEEENKKTLYIPNRFRIIGLMNNADKSYTYDFSHALARRFYIINVLPPKEEQIQNELVNVKNKVKKKILKTINEFESISIDESFIDNIFTNSDFCLVESKMIELLKTIRYKNDEDDAYLNIQFGTAQLIDLYKSIVVKVIVKNRVLTQNEYEQIVDIAVAENIIPQIDGVDLTKLKEFSNHLNSNYSNYKHCKESLENLL